MALVAVALLVLPIGVPSGWSPPVDGSPVPWLLLLLVASVGLPFFVVSASAPLLQTWLASTDHPDAEDPYFLYRASNAGSVVGLVAYPLLVEPRLTLGEQSWLWSGGFVLLGRCWRCAGSRCGARARPRGAKPRRPARRRASRSRGPAGCAGSRSRSSRRR